MKRRTAVSEDARQLVHIAVGAAALLLRYLTWFVALHPEEPLGCAGVNRERSKIAFAVGFPPTALSWSLTGSPANFTCLNIAVPPPS